MLKQTKVSDNEFNLFLLGEVGGFSDGFDSWGVSKALDEIENKKAKLNVYLSSIGGYVDDGLAIYDSLAQWQGETSMTVVNGAYSIASVLALSCDNLRFASTAELMIHSASIELFPGAILNAGSIKSISDRITKNNSRICSIYAEHSENKSYEEFLGLLEDGEDHYYTPKNITKELGFECSSVNVRKLFKDENLWSIFDKAKAKLQPTKKQEWFLYANEEAMNKQTQAEQDATQKETHEQEVKQEETKAESTENEMDSANEEPTAQPEVSEPKAQAMVVDNSKEIASKFAAQQANYEATLSAFSKWVPEETRNELLIQAVANNLSTDELEGKAREYMKSRTINETLPTANVASEEVTNKQSAEEPEHMGKEQVYKAAVLGKMINSLSQTSSVRALGKKFQDTLQVEEQEVKNAMAMPTAVLEELYSASKEGREVDVKELDAKAISTSALPLTQEVIGDLWTFYKENSQPTGLTSIARPLQVKNFKKHEVLVPVLDNTPFLPVTEGGEVQYSEGGLASVMVKLSTFGAGIRITREALVNDDIGFWTAQMANIITRQNATLENDAINTLVNFPDAKEVTDKTKYYDALRAAKDALYNMKALDKDGNETDRLLRLEPKYLVADRSLEDQVRTLVTSDQIGGRANPIKHWGLELVFVDMPADKQEHKLFLLADQSMVLAQLAGNGLRSQMYQQERLGNVNLEYLLDYAWVMDKQFSKVVKIKTTTIKENLITDPLEFKTVA